MRYTFTYDELSVLQKIFDEMDINVLSNEESDKQLSANPLACMWVKRNV